MAGRQLATQHTLVSSETPECARARARRSNNAKTDLAAFGTEVSPTKIYTFGAKTVNYATA